MSMPQAGCSIGFAWPLRSESSLDTEQMLIVAAAGPVEDVLDHRWPPG